MHPIKPVHLLAPPAEPVAGEKWKHEEGERVVIVELGEVHTGPNTWIRSVSYRGGDGVLRTRPLEGDFLERFTRAPA